MVVPRDDQLKRGGYNVNDFDPWYLGGSADVYNPDNICLPAHAFEPPKRALAGVKTKCVGLALRKCGSVPVNLSSDLWISDSCCNLEGLSLEPRGVFKVKE